jgi:chromosome segregation ATPase
LQNNEQGGNNSLQVLEKDHVQCGAERKRILDESTELRERVETLKLQLSTAEHSQADLETQNRQLRRDNDKIRFGRTVFFF